jgi:hypothetical protein
MGSCCRAEWGGRHETHLHPAPVRARFGSCGLPSDIGDVSALETVVGPHIHAIIALHTLGNLCGVRIDRSTRRG